MVRFVIVSVFYLFLSGGPRVGKLLLLRLAAAARRLRTSVQSGDYRLNFTIRGSVGEVCFQKPSA